jgi:hypothetical protein
VRSLTAVLQMRNAENPESAMDHMDDPEVARILQAIGMGRQRNLDEGLDGLYDSAGIG